VPGDHQVENRRLMMALELARSKAGRPRSSKRKAANRVLIERDRVTGILCGADRLNCGVVVICRRMLVGPVTRTGRIEGRDDPARGQMIGAERLRLAESITLAAFEQVLCGLPRLDGAHSRRRHCRVCRVSERDHRRGISALLAAAIEVAPSLQDCEIVETWSGLATRHH
jgi:glycine/D-amino acid oxidase-like deaminating enzyme